MTGLYKVLVTMVAQEADGSDFLLKAGTYITKCSDGQFKIMQGRIKPVYFTIEKGLQKFLKADKKPARKPKPSTS